MAQLEDLKIPMFSSMTDEQFLSVVMDARNSRRIPKKKNKKKATAKPKKQLSMDALLGMIPEGKRGDLLKQLEGDLE